MIEEKRGFLSDALIEEVGVMTPYCGSPRFEASVQTAQPMTLSEVEGVESLASLLRRRRSSVGPSVTRRRSRTILFFRRPHRLRPLVCTLPRFKSTFWTCTLETFALGDLQPETPFYVLSVQRQRETAATPPPALNGQRDIKFALVYMQRCSDVQRGV